MKTKRCILNKVNISDYDDIKKLYRNEDVRRFLGGTISSERYNDYFKEFINTNHKEFYWCVREEGSKEFVGLVSIDTHHDGINKEISYQFMPYYWGKGYAKEVIDKIIDFAFNELKLSKILCETQSANIASCKLLMKLGMNIEETIIRFCKEQYIFSIYNNYENII